ncbi:MAG: hypothetical protein ACI91R_001915 [Vicingaceae bacterium]|jgi:hypothetical protein
MFGHIAMLFREVSKSLDANANKEMNKIKTAYHRAA